MRIQLCPAFMDWIVFLVLFAVLYSAGERGLTGSQHAWLGAITMMTYTVVSLLVGLILTRRNARILLLLSTVATTLCGAASVMLQDFAAQMVCLALLGVGLAAFFNSFQTFMRGETVPGQLALTVARYTLAWSAGSSLGFLSWRDDAGHDHVLFCAHAGVPLHRQSHQGENEGRREHDAAGVKQRLHTEQQAREKHVKRE